MADPLERLYGDFEALVAKLDAEPSLLSTTDDVFRKVLLLAAASFFEARMTAHVGAFALEASDSSSLIAGLVARKAINRQYHSWFDWDKNKATQFYSLFGSDFTAFMKDKHQSELWLDGSVQAFLEIGRSRNQLVHGNFATFVLEKTAGEIKVLYGKALPFVEAVPSFLSECNRRLRNEKSRSAES